MGYAYRTNDGELQIWRDDECIYRRAAGEPWAAGWTHNATEIEIARFEEDGHLRADLEAIAPGNHYTLPPDVVVSLPWGSRG